MLPLKGVRVPTTNIWDVTQINNMDELTPAFKELLVRLYQNLNVMANAINTKDSGLFDTNQFVNNQAFFPAPGSPPAEKPLYRQVIRLTINFGALPNAGTKSVAHGITITPKMTITRLYAAASDTTGNNYIPIPYASPTLVNNIELNMDATNVNIITGSNRSNFNICYVVIEYIQT
jgi:hypothetical protein